MLGKGLAHLAILAVLSTDDNNKVIAGNIVRV